VKRVYLLHTATKTTTAKRKPQSAKDKMRFAIKFHRLARIIVCLIFSQCKWQATGRPLGKKKTKQNTGVGRKKKVNKRTKRRRWL